MSTNWETSLLRLSVFTDHAIENPDNKWWEDLLGRKPLEKSFKPNQGRFEVYGLYKENDELLNEVLIRLVTFLNRIDWYISFKSDIPVTKLSWGSFDLNIGEFENLMGKWLTSLKLNINRLAFGAILTLPVESKVEGYEKLNYYLPEIKIEPASSDFLFQINKPRKSAIINGLKINRLTKWNVINKSFQLTVSGIAAPIKSEDIYACMLEMDINTDQDNKETIESDKCIDILKELIKIGKEIAREGNKK